MKKRIEQLINGIFEYEPDRLEISRGEIQVHAAPDAVVHGSFQVKSSSGKKVQGVVYVSSPRVLCEPAQFQGIENVIQYQIDCSGLTEGMQERGQIVLSSELGEYEIPFEIGINAQGQEKEILEFQNLDEFAALARQNFQRAYKCFLSPAFREFLREREPGALALYDGLAFPGLCSQSLEEFLTGTGKKQAVELAVDREFLLLEDLSEPVRETLQLTKNTWGFQNITVESDARFLRPEKKEIVTDEFAGSCFSLNLIIDTNLMHAGKNYARLTISTARQNIQVTVEARRAGARQEGRQSHICKIMIKKMESLYVDFRLKKIDMTTWVENSISVINSYKRAGGRDPFAELFLVQLYFADGKKQKGFKLLESLEAQKSRLDTPERYGFYLYMTTFFYHEASYVDRVEEEIARLFYRDKTNWKLQWILLYIQESFLKDENARYEAVAEQFRYGCRSRIMYLEAYQVLKQNPFLMRHLGKFELQLLSFAAKEQILTAEVIRQVASLAAHSGVFEPRLYEVLAEGYQMYPSSDLVRSICLLLMRGDKKDSRYFPWYARGVEAGLRITGLYEYYMETMDKLDMQTMPQVIRMYFAYDDSLDYRRRAAIYRRIIDNKEKDSQTYHNYRASMEKFALDQLEAMHITEDLIVIYSKFLRKNMLTKTMAEKLARILCMYQVRCDQPGARGIIVHSDKWKKERRAPIVEGRALVEIYDPDSVLLVEDEKGNRYFSEPFCQVEKLLDNEDMMVWCLEKASGFPGMALYFCIQCLNEGILDHRTLPYFRKACEMREFSDEFLARLRREVLHYYVNHLREDSLPDFLEHIPYLEYVKVDKTALITLLAEEGRCTEAFALLDTYGAEGIALLQLVRICSRMVLELEFAENAMLVSLCHSCFVSGKYDDKLLRYLLLYFEGPVQEMKQLWQAAVQFDLDTMLVEERIITMILFTRSGTQNSEQIFESYLRKMGRKKLCRGYVNLKAYEYFVKGLPVAAPVFQYIEREYQYLRRKQRLEEQEEVCRLALLQYYAKSVELSEEQRARAEEMLEEFNGKGMRFSFWKQFDRELLAPYQMEGRVFAEYVCDPGSKVTIYYRIQGRSPEYTSENVQNYFEGIFVREFTLFEGEELECYLEEERSDEKRRSDKWVLRTEKQPTPGTSRYGALNRISEAQSQGNPEALREELESYLTLEHLVSEVFTTI